MRFLAVIGVVLLALVAGAAAYAYFGFYNIAASDPHLDPVRWVLERVQDHSVERHASEEVGEIPSLSDPEMIQTGARHYNGEGCIQCHGGPSTPQAQFARQMRPEPPDLSQAASEWSDAQLFWIMSHGIKMTGMPAFGPTHDERELWAMVAFVRRLPEMSEAEFSELIASGEHRHGEAGGHEHDQSGGSEEGGAHQGHSRQDQPEQGGHSNSQSQ